MEINLDLSFLFVFLTHGPAPVQIVALSTSLLIYILKTKQLVKLSQNYLIVLVPFLRLPYLTYLNSFSQWDPR